MMTLQLQMTLQYQSPTRYRVAVYDGSCPYTQGQDHMNEEKAREEAKELKRKFPSKLVQIHRVDITVIAEIHDDE